MRQLAAMLVTALCCVPTAGAQATAIWKPVTIPWSATYSATGNDEHADCTVALDGGFWLAGTADEGTGSSAPWIVRLEPGGQVRWSRRYKVEVGGVDDVVLSIERTADGGAVLSGQTASDPPTSWVMLVDPDGQPIWRRRLLVGLGWDDASILAPGDRVLQNLDGSFLLASTAVNTASGFVNRDVVTVRISPTGQIDWTRAFGQVFVVFYLGDYVADVDLTFGGGHYVVGNTTGGGGFWGWILRLDPSGNLIQQGILSDLRARAVATMLDGGAVVAGQDEIGRVTLIRLDPIGLPIWQRQLSSTTAQFDVAELVATPGDGVALVGNRDGTTFWIAEFDPGGDLMWQREVGGFLVGVHPSSVEVTSEGALVVAGTSEDQGAAAAGDAFPSGRAFWCFRLDRNGKIVMSSASGAFAVPGTADITPGSIPILPLQGPEQLIDPAAEVDSIAATAVDLPVQVHHQAP